MQCQHKRLHINLLQSIIIFFFRNQTIDYPAASILTRLAFFIKSLTMDVSTLISSERLNNRRDNSSNDTTTFENRDITQVNVGRGRDLFCSYSFNESQRNSQDDTDCLQRLHLATDIIQIICAVVIIFLYSYLCRYLSLDGP